MKKIVFLSVLLMLTLCSVVKADYLLGAGDLVKIVVYDEPELSIEAQVDSLGVMSYPFIGSLSMKISQ
jgi:protein involved in polysaccharide export with SLBB domain